MEEEVEPPVTPLPPLPLGRRLALLVLPLAILRMVMCKEDDEAAERHSESDFHKEGLEENTCHDAFEQKGRLEVQGTPSQPIPRVRGT